MKEKGQLIFLSILFLSIGSLLTIWYFKSQRVCYDLPKHGGTDEWGPKYWYAIHDVASRVPCSLCREEAIEMMRFIHDRVNLKLEKQIVDKENFVKWLDKIADIKSKYNAEQ